MEELMSKLKEIAELADVRCGKYHVNCIDCPLSYTVVDTGIVSYDICDILAKVKYKG